MDESIFCVLKLSVFLGGYMFVWILLNWRDSEASDWLMVIPIINLYFIARFIKREMYP